MIQPHSCIKASNKKSVGFIGQYSHIVIFIGELKMQHLKKLYQNFILIDDYHCIQMGQNFWHLLQPCVKYALGNQHVGIGTT